MTSPHLTEQQVQQLLHQGCTATDWRAVNISPSTDLQRIQRVHFFGSVVVGDLSGSHIVDEVEMRCGIYHASISNCVIGNQVRVAHIGSAIANYVVEDGVVIQNVAALTATPGASFGNGVEVETINEGGGRTVTLVNDLTAQVAFAQAMMRHNDEFNRRLSGLLRKHAQRSVSDRGKVGTGARLLHCGPIRNVNIGPYAYLHGARSLDNGTINSSKEHTSEVGADVQAKSFVIAEGARIESGAILDKVFVGQGVKMGKQFSAENSLFFANCEAFHGEAVAVFAGPYTVTHHKSTLLIAGVFSFYNAGSGSNQSNHMYKLGPVHQGILERGCKTGSFSYLLHENHIGAFSVVIGKHYTNMNVPHLPFSYIHEEEGVSKIIPGMNLFSVGMVRDGEKWPKRDHRKATDKRDLIVFDIFSPYTVEKMRRGRDELLKLSEIVPKEKSFVQYGGLQLSRLLLKKGAKYYSLAIDRYLHGKVLDALMRYRKSSKQWDELLRSLTPTSDLRAPGEWTDISGLLTPRERMAALESDVASGSITGYEEVRKKFQEMFGRYAEDEWKYVCETYASEYGVKPNEMTKEQAAHAVQEWEKAATSLHGMILEDSKKEFGAFAHIGYGVDQSDEHARKDFEAVRGTIDTNPVVQKLLAEGVAIANRRDEVLRLIENAS
jgi:NDP-sugar pyrophosphorylase family protein